MHLPIVRHARALRDLVILTYDISASKLPVRYCHREYSHKIWHLENVPFMSYKPGQNKHRAASYWQVATWNEFHIHCYVMKHVTSQLQQANE